MIRITNTGTIFVNAIKVAEITIKRSDCISKQLVLAANAVRIVENNLKQQRRPE